MKHACSWNIQICCPSVEMPSLGLRPRDDMSTSGQHIWMFHLQPCIICIMWWNALYFTFHFCYYWRRFLHYIIHWVNLIVTSSVFGRLTGWTASWGHGEGGREGKGIVPSRREAVGTHWQQRCAFGLEWSWLLDRRLMHGLEMSEVLHTHAHVLGQRGCGWGTNTLFFTTFNKYVVVVSLFKRF